MPVVFAGAVQSSATDVSPATAVRFVGAGGPLEAETVNVTLLLVTLVAPPVAETTHRYTSPLSAALVRLDKERELLVAPLTLENDPAPPSCFSH